MKSGFDVIIAAALRAARAVCDARRMLPRRYDGLSHAVTLPIH